LHNKDTIVALSSAAGKAGVSVIRISGDAAFAALQSLTHCPLPSPRIATLQKLKHSDGAIMDKALILCFPAPHSFTGEDVVELHIHGSRAIQRSCLAHLVALPNTRLADAGEFTRRAFDSGKMDLLEVEALVDVINAETEAQVRQALRQFEGHIGKAYATMRASIVECLALLEAYIDFPEEDIPESVLTNIRISTEKLIASITSALLDRCAGERIRNGFRVAIVGAPNVGKSSLLNALAKRDAAIVSAIPGTTRDVIALSMDIGGYPVILSDTAGIRKTSDDIELIGISLSKSTIAEADLVLVLCDATKVEASLDVALLDELKAHKSQVICCINKSDLSKNTDKIVSEVKKHMFEHGINILHVIEISVFEKTNLDKLEKSISDTLNLFQPTEEPIITQARHRRLLELASHHLQTSLGELPLELKCEELRLAGVSIGNITGAILADELLGEIFSKFCIGK
jgi:tRNA modification GTPase